MFYCSCLISAASACGTGVYGFLAFFFSLHDVDSRTYPFVPLAHCHRFLFANIDTIQTHKF